MIMKSVGRWKRNATSRKLIWVALIRSGPTFASQNLTSPGSRQANTSKKPPSDPPFAARKRSMARKRPALFPAFDSMVARALGVYRQDFDPWDCLWEYFYGDRSRIAAVEELRAAVGGIGDISLLRCIEVALWMRGKRGS